ncbi:sensor histidine kinase [Phytohabitans suffuscus]|uniref:Histidine kinase domain-containing protein n=1 Tax=Phytohabitans suffuscus TaxID=624315 RepID=A0A6F8YUT5_9ACTN|nr:ATP-binding protein [Phytohabitans suffuscus]BCB89601.1 hypothetical protein Psuf_069140 [Phytohabitans suffuscus]
MRRAVARHLAAAAATTLVLATLVTLGAWRLARQDAHHIAERIGRQVATAVLAPISAYDLARPTTADRAGINDRLDPFLRSRMVNRVKVFTVQDGRGTVVYSDEPRAERQTEHLSPALGIGDVLVQPVPDDPAHRFENALAGARMEVFFGFRDARGNDASLELYVPVDVPGGTQRGVMALLPVVMAGLCLATIALLPVSFAHVRRARRHRDERQAALRYALTAADRTRHDLARRLHDTVIPDLSAAGLLLERATSTPARTDLLTRVHRLVTAEIRQLRTLLTDLLPATDDDPAAALGDTLARVRAEFPDQDLSIELTVEPAVSADPDTVAVLRQIATELLRNTMRHANARRVRIHLTTASGGAELTLSVGDDGAGFDPARPAPPGHAGLRLLAQLVADTGGRLTIDSRPGSGTLATVHLAPDRHRGRRTSAGRPATTKSNAAVSRLR